jgi:autotransporter-associated beta strand protein
VTGNIVINSSYSSYRDNCTFTQTSGIVTAAGITTVTPATTTSSYVMGASSPTLNLTSSTPFTLGAGGTNTITLNGTGATVDYQSSTSFTLLNVAGLLSYRNLIISGGSGNVKSLGANTTLSGTLSIKANSTLNLVTYTLLTPTSVTLEVSGGLSGAAITGSGLLTLGGDITVNYSGSGAIASGASIAPPVALGAASRTITVMDDGFSNIELTMSGTISGVSGIIKAGTGSLLLSGANSSYTGATTISAGTLLNGGNVAVSTNGPFGNASTAISLGNAATTTNNSSVALLTNGAYTISRTITVANQSTTGTYTIGGNTDNSSTFSGAITYNKPVIVTQVATTGVNTLTISGGMTSSTAANAITFNNAGSVTISTTAIAAGTGTSVVKNNSGILSMNIANLYTGGTTLNAGTIGVGIVSGLGAMAQPVVLNGGSLDLNTNTTINAYNIVVGGAATIISDKLTAATAGITQTLGTLSIGAFNLTISGGTNATSGTTGIAFAATTFTGPPVFTITNGSGTSVAQLSVAAVTNAANTATINGNGSMIQTGIWGVGAGSGGINYGGSGSITLSQANIFTGGVTLNSGTLNINNASALGAATGTFTINGGTIDNTTSGITTSNYPLALNGDFTCAGSNSINLGTGTTSMNNNHQITVSANTLTLGGVLSAGSYDLTKAGSGTLSFGNNAVTLKGLIINSGTLISTSGILSVAGNFSNYGTFTPGTGTVTFNGSGLQLISGNSNTTFNNFRINNSNGINLNGTTNTFINGILTFSNGRINTGIYTLVLGNSASVSGASSTMYVYGNLQKGLATGITSMTFEIGDAASFTPVALTFTATTNNTGSITTYTTAGDHPQIATSDINPSLSVNRYWTLINNGVTGITTYNATFTFVAGDIDGGANTSNFTVQNYLPSTWTSQTIGTKTATSTQATGITLFGDFQIGEAASAPTACLYADNGMVPAIADFMPCINFASNPQTVSYAFTAHQYFTMNVIKGITYEVYSCSSPAPSSPLMLSVYQEGAPASSAIAFSYANTGNTCTAVTNNAYVSFTSPFSGKVRVLVNKKRDCSSSSPSGLTIMVNASGGSNTLDNQSIAGTNTWTGHIYDATNTAILFNGTFSNYLGYYSEPELFDESFGGSTNCFSPVKSNDTARASIYTETYSVRYRMISSRDGLYVVDLGSDDGSRLAVDGTLVYNNWSDQAYTLKPRVLISLTGTSSLVYDFYENGGANEVTFNNLTLVLANNLTTNSNQNVCLGNAGTAISGDTYGTLPTGITLSGTGYQWTYSTTPAGTRTVLSGATAATYSPNSASAPFNVAGTYYLYRNAVLSGTNNIAPNPYVATNESNAAVLTVNALNPVSVSISANPTGTICAGTSVTFTAVPVNGGVSPAFQWKKNGTNVGSSSTTYTDATLASGDVITCLLTSNISCPTNNPATSNAVTMTVTANLPVSVSISASSNPVCSGVSVTFTATPVNGGTSPTYQWKVNGINAGTNSATFSSAALNNNDVVSCSLTSNVTCVSGNPATSNAVIMIVNPILPVSVSISPSANPICSGSSVTFTATPVNGGASPSYQWKVNGTNVGTNLNTYSSSALSNGDIVTCVVTSNATCPSGNPATSNAVTMTVTANLPVSVSISASSNPVCSGVPVTFTAIPVNGGASPSYQWKVNGVNAGTNSPNFTTSGLINGNTVTCTLTSNLTCASGNPATSNTITMTVNPTLPVSVTIAASQNPVCQGTNVTFTATPVNGGASPTYQWKVNGINAGTNSATFSSAALNNNDVVSCSLTSNATCVSGNPATSNSITMTVNPNLPVSVSISSNPTGSVCQGTTVVFTAVPINGGGSPVYQWKKNGINVGTNSATYSDAGLANNDIIICILTSNITCSTGNPATSNSITMVVNPILPVGISISATPATTICSGTLVTFTASPTNGGNAPVYQWKKNGNNVGANSPTYQNAALVNNDVIACIVTSNANCISGNPATSNTLTMVVNPLLPVSVTISANPSGSICSGTNVTFTASIVNGGGSPSYQWQKNGINVGSSTATWSDATLANNDLITCILTSNATCPTGNPATSNSINAAVNPIPVAPVSAIANPASIYSTYTGTITLTATGGGSGSGDVLRWYSGGCGTGPSVGSGNPLTIPAPPSTTTYYARWENGSCYSGCTTSQVTVMDVYRSKVSGNWNDVNTWEVFANDASVWVNATRMPVATDGTITIRSPHTVTIIPATGSINVDELTIDAGGKLVVNLNPSGYWLNVVNGPGVDLTVNGTLEYQDDIVQLLNGAQMVVGSGGKYQHNMNYAGNYPITLPAATWDQNSTCEILSCNQLAISGGLNQTFGNFTWNYSGQTATVNLAGALQNILGNFTITSTGTGKVQLTNTTDITFNVGKDFILQNGYIDFANGAASTKIFNLYGNYNHTGGTFINTDANLLTVNFKGVSKTFTQSGGTLTSANIAWNINTGASLSLQNNLPVSAGRNCVVNGTLDCGISTNVAGAGTFTHSPGATLIIGSPDGITQAGATGNIRTAVRSFSNTANYIYNGLSPQSAGNALPSIVNNLTINNPAGVTLNGSSGVNGVLSLLTGSLSLGPNSFIFQNSDTPIQKSLGTITTDPGTNLSFGTAGNTAGAAFTIPDGTFTSTPTINNLTLNRVNSLTLNNQPLSIKGILLSNGPLITNNNLTLLSTSGQTALIDGSGTGQVSGNVTVQRYIPSAFGYTYFSSPFTSAQVSQFSAYVDLNATFPNFYRYDENQANKWWIAYTNPSAPLTPSQGYAANLGTSKLPVTISLSGVVSNGSLPVTLFNHNYPFTTGFNLVGNPYPSPIDWDASSGWIRTNTDNAVYYFNAGDSSEYTGKYSSYINGISSDGIAGSIIPSLQGFFVHVSNGAYPVSGSLTFTNSARVNNLNPLFHKPEGGASIPLLRFTAGYENSGGNRDPMVVYFNESASSDFDKNFDALKLMNTDFQIPNLYSFSSDAFKLSIKALPSMVDSITVLPIGLETEKDGWVSFHVSDLENFPSNLRIYFSDNKTGICQNLDLDRTARINLKAGQYNDRLSLIFSLKDLQYNPSANENFYAYSFREILYIYCKLEPAEKGRLMIYNMMGQMVYSSYLFVNGYQQITTDLQTGLYVLSLTSSKGTYLRKVFLTNY